jgi:hypothetical protein
VRKHTSVVLKCILDNLTLELHLIGVGDVLQLAPSTRAKVLAQDVVLGNSVLCRLDNLNKISVRITPKVNKAM